MGVALAVLGATAIGRVAAEPAPPVPAGPATAAPAAPVAAPAVEYRDDRVTLHVEHVVRADVLAAIARATGAELHGQVADAGEVTITLDATPLNDALHRLLGTQSFTVIYGEGTRVRAIDLRGGPHAGPPPGLAAGAAVLAESPAWQNDERLQAAAAALGTVAQRQIAVNGRLAQALGTRTTTFERLAQAALVNRDPHVRARALRTALGVLEGEPELRAALATTMTVLPTETLVRFTRDMAGDNAVEFAGRVTQAARTPEVRRQAGQVLGALRAPE
jgi:hypothetical protein